MAQRSGGSQRERGRSSGGSAAVRREAARKGGQPRARRRQARKAARETGEALRTADPVIIQADRARRVAGGGPSFPITGYDGLTAAPGAGPPRHPERRGVAQGTGPRAPSRNRKTVLAAIESKLG